MLTAALFPGAAVFARPAGQFVCFSVTSDAVTQAVQSSTVILVASVKALTPGEQVVLQPEVVLKGAVPNSAVEIPYPQSVPTGCRLASFTAGTRVFVFLGSGDGHLLWPSSPQLFLLNGGAAVQQENQGLGAQTEAGLVALVRDITNQYAVPAQTKSEGAGIDWMKTVLPVGAALLVVFAIGLWLMKIWHRIDPT